MKILSLQELHKYVDEEMDDITETIRHVAPENLLFQEITREMYHEFVERRFPNGLAIAGTCSRCEKDQERERRANQN